MSRSYPVDTQSQRALQEVYEKEDLFALKFFLANHKPDEIDAPKITAVRKAFQLEIPEVYAKKLEKRAKGKINTELQEIKERISIPPDDVSLMRPASPATRKLLFGKYGNAKGYLKWRLELNPDEKYEIPVTTAMDYGWKLFELLPKSEITHPQFGRINVIRRSFYSNGRASLKMGEDIL